MTEIHIVENGSEDAMEASIEQTDNSSDFVNNETANDYQRFSEHQTLEQNEQSFYCHTCKIKFEKERYFKTHMNIHEEITVKQLYTTCCSAKCSSMYHLFLHKRKKHDMFKNIKRLKYACTKCNRFFAHNSTWENHSKNKCPNMTDKCCKYCKAKFTTKLILHLKKKHQNIFLEHKCNRCYAIFKEKLDLVEHIREIHDLESPNELNTKEKYVCKLCGKKFNSSRLWKNHERIHTVALR
ncbi:PREDICTED: zinc finger protein 260-like [Wasmannia auropunctata]|uniref:zinc finger protein 260-like n=1 Tax=Wasmannia auropunctata TaxID=64793 RepID=UPI0005ED87ED|nr:PREDICTED: zinc finger protein 260-like [Wasmannia auropunctata]